VEDTAAGEDSGATDGTWTTACPTDRIEARMIDVGEVSLNVGCMGDGPVVVLLHGFPEFHYAWREVMEALAGDYRLIVPDQRGYNLSDKPESVEAYALPYLARDIVDLIPLVSAEPVLVVAHDWGGPVGWLVAHHPEAQVRGILATNGPHPARFAELIATDPAQQEASAYMDFFRSAGAEAYLTPERLASDFFPFLSDQDLEVYMAAWAQPGAITGGLNWYRANSLEPDDIAAVMAEVNPTVEVPATVMWGLDDDAVLPSNAEGLDPWVSDLQVETYPGVDHWIEHRIPEEVARAVRELDARAGRR
jgi:pimeloyl-ACP methyl ester carboxylesterase